jgi:hypothetical protein
MTELEKARAHLRECQTDLRKYREKVGILVPPGVNSRQFVREWRVYERKRRENAFLAALSWVWDAQERDPTHRFVTAVEAYFAGAITANEMRAKLGLPPIPSEAWG